MKKIEKAKKLLEKSVVTVYTVEQWYGGPEEGGWYGHTVEVWKILPVCRDTDEFLADAGIDDVFPFHGGDFYRIEKKVEIGKEEYETSRFWDQYSACLKVQGISVKDIPFFCKQY